MLKRIRNWDGPVILCHQCDQWISESKWHEHHLPGGCPLGTKRMSMMTRETRASCISKLGMLLVT